MIAAWHRRDAGRRLVRMIAVAALSAVPGAPTAQPARQLLPVDEAARDPSFFAFRAQLLTAVARRDAGAILAVVHPDIKNSLGGDQGLDEFKSTWRLDRAESEFWAEFGETLALGGAFQGPDGFVAPYTFTRWPNGLDAFEHVVATSGGVPARAEARDEAAVLATLDFSIVRIGKAGYGGDPQGWQQIALADGRQAYVRVSSVRSPIDYRAYFVRRDGRWRLMMFLAGD